MSRVQISPHAHLLFIFSAHETCFQAAFPDIVLILSQRQHHLSPFTLEIHVPLSTIILLFLVDDTSLTALFRIENQVC